MSLEELAYLADIIGVIFVIASLIYVAQQLHQNTHMMRAESRNEIQHGHQQEILMIVQYPDIWRRFTGETLDDDSIRVNQSIGIPSPPPDEIRINIFGGCN